MKGVFRFRRTAAVLAGAVTALVIASVGAFANPGQVTVCFPNAGGAISTLPCTTGETAVTLSTFTATLRNFNKDGVSGTFPGDNIFHPVITMTQVPDGFYFISAKSNIDEAIETRTAWNWECNLIVLPDNAGYQLVDSWEVEQLSDAVANLNAEVNIGPTSTGTSTIRLDCRSNVATGWVAAWSKIKLIDAANLVQMNGL
jgi:hypothetical protein